jgi:hypothetical protein
MRGHPVLRLVLVGLVFVAAVLLGRLMVEAFLFFGAFS